MKKLSLFLLLAIFSSVVFGQASGADDNFVLPPEKANPVTVPKFASPPVIDGKLDDDVWKTATVFKDFIQIRPGDNIAPTKPTIAYMGYDSQNLYFGFHCFDDPNLIRATVAKRDNVNGEDNVRVGLDTFNDQRRSYVLFFNPFGIQADGISSDGQQGGGGQGGPDLSVDIVMESKGMLLPDGWSVEAKVPFKSLRFIAGKGKMWGINFSRQIERMNGEVDSWMPIKRNVPSVRQYGKITGLDGIKQERNLEIVPSVTLSEAGERIADASVPNQSRMLNHPMKQDIGVSIKYQITPNVTVDVAVNPDFAEVEADAPVVRANERFPIFFPEKRPFFLEGIDYFRTGLQAVNTRNIADPDVAVKLTGKTGKNTFGILGAIDRFPNTDTKAYAGVLRLKRDIGPFSNIGLIATTYHFGSQRHNTLLGIDGRFQLNEKTNFNFEVLGTRSLRSFYNPDTDTRDYRAGNGIAYSINYDYTGLNRGFFMGVTGRSRDYRADLGFTRRTNTHGARIGFRLGKSPTPQNFLIGFNTRHFFGGDFDEQGNLQNARYNVNGEFSFQKQWRVGFGADVGEEKIYEYEFGKRRQSINGVGRFFGGPSRNAVQYGGRIDSEKTFSKKFSIDAGIGFKANTFDLDFGASERYPRVSPAFLADSNEERLDPGRGFTFFYDIGMDLTPTDPLTISLSYERERLTRRDNGLVAFDSSIFSLRSTYQFTRFTFFRTRWDYETVEGGVSGQLLFGWSPNPGTAFYIGYNDNLSYKGFNEFTNAFNHGLLRSERRFFIRASYLFRRSF